MVKYLIPELDVKDMVGTIVMNAGEEYVVEGTKVIVGDGLVVEITEMWFNYKVEVRSSKYLH